MPSLALEGVGAKVSEHPVEYINVAHTSRNHVSYLYLDIATRCISISLMIRQDQGLDACVCSQHTDLFVF